MHHFPPSTPSSAGGNPAESPPHWLSHLEWVRVLALSLARDEASADELVQETALVALRRADHVRSVEPGVLRGWLRAVLKNEQRMGWRRDRLRRGHEEDSVKEAVQPEAEHSLDPSLALERLELTKAVVAAVERLDDPCRRAVLGRYFDGRGVTQMAADESVSVRTMESRLRRARAQLRDELRRNDESAGRCSGYWTGLVIGARGLQPKALVTAAQAGLAAKGVSWLVLVMKLKVKVVAVVCALLATMIAIAWWGPTPEEPSGEQHQVADIGPNLQMPNQDRLASLSHVEPKLGRTAPASREPEVVGDGAPSAALPVLTLATCSLHGRVVDEGGVPLHAPGTEGLEVVLAPVEPTKFRVLDADSGQPIERFGLVVLYGKGRLGTGRAAVPMDLPQVVVHPGGEAVLAARVGYDVVCLFVEGYGPSIHEVFASSGSTYHPLRARRQRAVTGRFVGNGVAIAHAMVELQTGFEAGVPSVEATTPSMSFVAQATQVATTDEFGRFDFAFVKEGSCRLRLYRGNLPPTIVGPMILGPAGDGSRSVDLGDVKAADPGGDPAGSTGGKPADSQ